MVLFIFGIRRKSYGAISGNYGGWIIIIVYIYIHINGNVT